MSISEQELEKGALDQSLIASVSVTPAVLGKFSDAQLAKAWGAYNEWFGDAIRMDQPAHAFVTPGENIYNEMKKRGLRISNRMPLSPMFTNPKEVNLPLAKAGMPMASAGTTWDEGAARAALRKWATKPDGTVDTAKYGQGFLFHGTPSTLLTSYKFPIATVINGTLTAVPNAIRAAKGRLLGSSIPAAAKARIASVLAGYSKRLGWNDMHKSAVEPQIPVLKEGQPLIAFVEGSPDETELKRGKPMVGVAGAMFDTNYLAPLGLKRSDVAILHQVPDMLRGKDGHARGPKPNEVLEWQDNLAQELDNLDPDLTIALGQGVGDTIMADFVLPHPKVLTKMAKSGSVNLAASELVRKIKVIKGVLAGGIEPQFVAIDMAKAAALPLAHEDIGWNEGQARKTLKAWAKKPDGTIDTGKYGRAFLYDPGTGKTSDMKFPIATVIDGVLFAIPDAIRAAKERFDQAQGIPAADKAKIAGQLAAYSKKLGWPTGTSGDTNSTSSNMSKSATLSDNEHQFGLFMADAPDKRNVVQGVVYAPNQLDDQNHWAPPEVLTDAAHWYMEHSQLADTEHQKLADARVVESYITSQPEKLGDRDIPVGSWRVAHSVSDDLKKEIDAGTYKGQSMFGRLEGLYGEAPPGYMAKNTGDVDTILKLTKIRPATVGFVAQAANKMHTIVATCEGADCPLN